MLHKPNKFLTKTILFLLLALLPLLPAATATLEHANNPVSGSTRTEFTPDTPVQSATGAGFDVGANQARNISLNLNLAADAVHGPSLSAIPTTNPITGATYYRYTLVDPEVALNPMARTVVVMLAMANPLYGFASGDQSDRIVPGDPAITITPAPPPRSTPEFDPADATVRAISLQLPRETRAGENFTITLFAEVSYPFNADIDATFYELPGGTKPTLVGKAKLNEKGQVELTLQQNIAGEYIYRARTNNIETEARLTVLPAAPARIEAEKTAFYWEKEREAEIKFIVKDTYGNTIKADPGASAPSSGTTNRGAATPALGTTPPGSANSGNPSPRVLPPGTLQITIIDPAGTEIRGYMLIADREDDYAVRFTPAQTGDYLVRAALPATGTSALAAPSPPVGQETSIPTRAETTVRSREFGAITGIAFTIENNGNEPWLRASVGATTDTGASSAAGANTESAANAIINTGIGINTKAADKNRLELTVELIGEYGLRRLPAKHEENNIIYSTNRPDLLQVERTSGGKALLTEKGKPGLTTVTVTYLPETGRGLQDSIELRISGQPTSINYKTGLDNLTAAIETALLDRDGQPALSQAEDYTILLPPRINILSKSPLQNGRANFTLQAEEYGNYTITMLTGDNLSLDIELIFEQTIIPTKHVIIFIGEKSYFKDGEPASMSHAPWISYGHAFVPVTFFADTFAIEILPSPSSRILTLRRDDREAHIDLTTLTLTYTEKNIAMTQPIGSLFLQEKDGVLFLPAVTISRLFGAQTDYQPKQGEVEHITFNIY